MFRYIPVILYVPFVAAAETAENINWGLWELKGSGSFMTLQIPLF